METVPDECSSTAVRLARIILGMLLMSACVHPPEIVPSPNVTFAAHVDHRGLIVDRVGRDQHGILESVGAVGSSNAPDFVLKIDGATAAAIWLKGADEVVRTAPDPAAPLIGHIHAMWDDSRAVRLVFTTADGATFRTDLFRRVDHSGGPQAVGEPATMTANARGVYVAHIRDHDGTSVGWLRAEVASRGSAVTQVYDGVLPSDLNGPLAVAAVAQLDSDVQAMRKNAIDPYQGN